MRTWILAVLTLPAWSNTLEDADVLIKRTLYRAPTEWDREAVIKRLREKQQEAQQEIRKYEASLRDPCYTTFDKERGWPLKVPPRPQRFLEGVDFNDWNSFDIEAIDDNNHIVML